MFVLALLLAAVATPGSDATTDNQPPLKPLPPGIVQVEFETLHCAGCAKQIARNLYKTPGVMRVKADMKREVISITMQPNKKVDLARVWAATKTKDAAPAALRIGDKRFVAKDFEKPKQQAQRRQQAAKR